MHKIFSVCNKPCFFPSILLELNIVIPEPIIIVIIVDRKIFRRDSEFLISSLVNDNVVRPALSKGYKIRHALVYNWLHTIISNTHLFVH